jgi:hypothetical protein
MRAGQEFSSTGTTLRAAPWCACAKHRFGGSFGVRSFEQVRSRCGGFASQGRVDSRPPLGGVVGSSVIHLVTLPPKAVLRTRTPKRCAQGGASWACRDCESQKSHETTRWELSLPARVAFTPPFSTHPAPRPWGISPGRWRARRGLRCPISSRALRSFLHWTRVPGRRRWCH